MVRPPPLQTFRPDPGDPATRNGEPYAQDIRNQVEFLIERKGGLLTSEDVAAKRATDKFPHWRTIQRWQVRRLRFGHMRAMRRSGNRQKPVLRGINLVLLALYRIVFPKATHYEVNAFLFRMNQGDPSNRFYSNSELTRAEKDLGFTRKRGSTTAYLALLPVNIRKRKIYFLMPYPYGIADILREDMIDLDECGIFLETCNRTSGLAYVGVRVRDEGPYSKSEKWTLLLAVSGEKGTGPANASRRWRKLWLEGGTTEEKFIDFVQEILDDLPHGDEGRRFCFTMDNLSCHHSAAVITMIFAHGHRIAFRAPYYPIDGPIEYVFNSIQAELRQRLPMIRTGENLVGEINRAIFISYDFSPYFINCGFWKTEEAQIEM